MCQRRFKQALYAAALKQLRAQNSPHTGANPSHIGGLRWLQSIHTLHRQGHCLKLYE